MKACLASEELRYPLQNFSAHDCYVVSNWGAGLLLSCLPAHDRCLGGHLESSRALNKGCLHMSAILLAPEEKLPACRSPRRCRSCSIGRAGRDSPCMGSASPPGVPWCSCWPTGLRSRWGHKGMVFRGTLVPLLADMQVEACSHGFQGYIGPPAGSHAGGGMELRGAMVPLLAHKLQTQVRACRCGFQGVSWCSG